STAAWNSNNCTVTPNAITAPDGTLTATKIEAATSAATNNSHVSVAATATNMVYSLYIKQGSGANQANWVAVRNQTTASTFQSGRIDLSTGAWTINTGSTPIIEQLADGWWRVSFVMTSGISISDLISV